MVLSLYHLCFLASSLSILCLFSFLLFFFFFNDTATTEIYTLSLHDALPICARNDVAVRADDEAGGRAHAFADRSEEHTSELQSHSDLVCSLLLEKKKKKKNKEIKKKIGNKTELGDHKNKCSEERVTVQNRAE